MLKNMKTKKKHKANFLNSAVRNLTIISALSNLISNITEIIILSMDNQNTLKKEWTENQ